MYELIQAGERTYYIDCPAKMGVYRSGEKDVCLIDSGNDKDAGKKVQRILEEKGWSLAAVINTHFHADHIGGNHLLQERLHCPVYSTGIENAFIADPILEPTFLYGGYPFRELRNKFLMASPSVPRDILSDELPKELEFLPLPGHSFGMTGVKTPDGVWFLADCVADAAVLEKYPVSFLCNVEAYLETLTRVEGLSGEWFIPAHAAATKDIRPLVALNRKKVLENIEMLLDICRTPTVTEEVLKQVFDRSGLQMNTSQYVLTGCTIRSYLSYLRDGGRLAVQISDNRLFWQTAGE